MKTTKILILLNCIISFLWAKNEGEYDTGTVDKFGNDSILVKENIIKAKPFFKEGELIEDYSLIKKYCDLSKNLINEVNRINKTDYQFWVAYNENREIILVFAKKFSYKKEKNITKISKLDQEIEIRFNRKTEKLTMIFVK